MITLVLGGVRSGKSEVAERVAGPGPGTYLATGLVGPDDAGFAERIARHQARRPASWATVEEPRAVPGVLARLHGVVLLDALGTWIANDLQADIDALVEALVHRPGDTIVVSEEVGLGVHPPTELGRLFADRLGEANRRVAAVADRCLLVVAGRVIELPTSAPPLASLSAEPPPAPLSTGPSPAPLSAVSPPKAQPVAPDERSRPSMPPERNRLRPMDDPTAEVKTRGGFRQALAFLTPLGGPVSPTQAAFVWFPVVGALLGLVLGAVWSATDDTLGRFAAAALVVVADLALTGALHFDGLLDTADGLLPHLSPERRLEVMAEPHVGAFAVATGAATLMLRTAAFTGLGAARPFLLAALWCFSRTAMAVTALTGRYARPHGLASSFLPAAGSDAAEPTAAAGAGRLSGTTPWMPIAAAGTVLALGLAAVEDVRSVLAVPAAAAAAAAVARLARHRIGGFTGDTLGAGGVVAETAGLLTALAVFRP